MAIFYANAIINGKDALGNVITFDIAMTNIKKKFGEEAMQKLKKEITAILINKGRSDLLK